MPGPTALAHSAASTIGSHNEFHPHLSELEPTPITAMNTELRPERLMLSSFSRTYAPILPSHQPPRANGAPKCKSPSLQRKFAPSLINQSLYLCRHISNKESSSFDGRFILFVHQPPIPMPNFESGIGGCLYVLIYKIICFSCSTTSSPSPGSSRLLVAYFW
jgi:hypothetical protein